MKARMTQLDLYKANFANIEDAYVQNIYYANNNYYIKLNMRIKTHVTEVKTTKVEPINNIAAASRKRYLNIGSTGVYLGDHVVGVNYFAKLMRKYLLRKCIKTISVVDGGVEIEFYGSTNPVSKVEANDEDETQKADVNNEETKNKEESKKAESKKKEELSKSERRALRKSKKSNKSHVQSKNIVDTLLIENPHLKNIPVSDWKKHINTNTNTKKPLITNTTKDTKMLRANKLIITISPFNIIMYSEENEMLGSLKSINEKQADEGLLKFEREELKEAEFNRLSLNNEKPIAKEVKDYLQTKAVFLTEKEINLNQFVSVLYELHIKNSKGKIFPFKSFCEEFLRLYISYLKSTTKGTAFYFKQESFYVPFKYENKKVDFLRNSIFSDFLKKHFIVFDSEVLDSSELCSSVLDSFEGEKYKEKYKEKHIDKHKEVFKYKEFHKNIDISIFNTSKCGGKLSDINSFSISLPLEYNELINNFYKETTPLKTIKPEKKKLNIKERAELSLKNLRKDLIEITKKMEFLENNTERFEKGLKLLNINLLESQIQEIIKREINCLVTFKTRGSCELKTLENSFKYEINYFEDLNENLKLLYNKKRKIQLKIKKTIVFLEGVDTFSKPDLSKKLKVNKKYKNKQVKNEEILKSRVFFWFEKYKFLISPEYLFIAGKNIKQNEELIKSHLNESEFYLHPSGNGPSLLLIKNELISFGCCQQILVKDNKKAAGDFMSLICKQKESFIVSSNQVSKVHKNERANKGAFFINGTKEFLEGEINNLKFTIGFLERKCRKCLEKKNVIYSKGSETSVLFGFYSVCLGTEWLQFPVNCSVGGILEAINDEGVKREVLSRKSEIELYIQQTLSL